jgi:hypothetical protein
VEIQENSNLAVLSLKTQPTQKAARTGSHALLKVLRKIHLYLGVFTAPALIFFAFTGALQTFSLHETTQGSSYKPPAWAVALGQLHKKQTTVVPLRKQRPGPGSGPASGAGSGAEASKGDRGMRAADIPGAKASRPADPGSDTGGKAPEAPAPKQKSHLPMKIFFLVVSVGLFLSTLTGVYMAYRYSRRRLLMSGLLAAGVVLPLLLLPY